MKKGQFLWYIIPFSIAAFLTIYLWDDNPQKTDNAVAETIAARVVNETGGEQPTLINSAPTVETTSEPTLTETPIPMATPEPQSGDTKVSPVDNMKMIFIPSTTFRMGVDEGSDSKNKPSREVELDAYWIDQTEVSNGQYKICMQAGACTNPSFTRSVTRLDYFDNSEYADFPVIYVTWYQAETYCKWAERELPTEAQWENAARGPEGYIYPWGNEIKNYVANLNPTQQDLMNVKSYLGGASPYGVLNMSGNVFEWVADWFDKSYYSYGDTYNPTGPLAAEFKSVRGGSFSGGQTKDKWSDWEYYGTWDGYDWYIAYLKQIKAKWEFNYQAITRFSWKPDGTNTIIGFRCALPSP